ncbi:hypothetical protein [Dyella telluris]|uniref:Uncharacterized protein n=1 Tax=Dyella telluris TaxID=2763498 RepID=A0A7G8Q7X8_9GAMM|nr:hypothetical protein [Dyella telluris]QNK02886.1 hypothetical protein H8F01_07135 [Dyella telluris]
MLLTAIAFIAVPLWGHLQGDAIARAQKQAHGVACGMPVLGILLDTLFLSGMISLVALVLAVLAYWKLARPRPVLRAVELVVVALPALLAVVVVVGLGVTGG